MKSRTRYLANKSVENSRKSVENSRKSVRQFVCIFPKFERKKLCALFHAVKTFHNSGVNLDNLLDNFANIHTVYGNQNDVFGYWLSLETQKLWTVCCVFGAFVRL